jgi:DNA polymerase-3 subunit gamma/tau
MGYTALYRQYRPLTFDQVAGQQHITTTLKNQVTGDRVAHAYLFAGTRGTGKTSTARILARAVNCHDIHNGNPCNSCEICSRALEGKLMDIIEIDAASNRGVDEIRDLREKVKYPPTEGRYRVYIVDEVHMLTAEAFNALLKTLEEPPSHVIFILATTEPHRLPATVLSRCQRFDFKRIPASDIKDLLKSVSDEAGIGIDQEALDLIAGRADGAARDALSMLDKCSTFQNGRLTVDKVVPLLGMAQDRLLFDLSGRLSARDAAGCLTLLGRAVEDGRDIGQLFKDIIHHLRDILIAKVAPSGLSDVSKGKREDLLALAGEMEVNTLIRAINTLSEAEAKAKWSTYPGIFLEVALVKICEPSMDASPEGVMDRLAHLEDIVFRNRMAPPAAAVHRPAGTDREYEGSAETTGSHEPGGKDLADPVKGDGAEAPKSSNGQGDDGAPEAGGSGRAGQRGGKPGGQHGTEAAGDQREDGRGDVTLEGITEAWNDVLKYLEKHRKGLFTVLRDPKPVRVKEDMLVVGCVGLHGIYHDIANSKENKEALRDAVHSVTGGLFEISVENADGERDTGYEGIQEDLSLYEEAVKVFGEDLVERLEDKDN